MYGFSVVWVDIWFFKWPEGAPLKSHRSHLHDFSSVWCNVCLCKLLDWVQLLSYTSFLYGISLACENICSFKEIAWVDLFTQILHLELSWMESICLRFFKLYSFHRNSGFFIVLDFLLCSSILCCNANDLLWSPYWHAFAKQKNNHDL